MKVGIIRCLQTEDYCPGTTDFKVIRDKSHAFEGIEEDIELVGFVSCGGCPGKKAVLRSRELVKRGADTIAFASCPARQPDRVPLPLCEKDEREHCERRRRNGTDSGLYALMLRVYELAHFNRCINEGLLQSPVMDEAMTVGTLEMMERLRGAWE